ncbi:MAG: endonuclease domain-containing protein [Saprospiraceae bacterium]|nr:endonuclease domain-containing protein [Saprospiraceae bacterium]
MRYFDTLQNARDHRKNPTEAEKIFWENVRGKKLLGQKFNRQFIIEYKEILGNKLYYIADFHNFEHKIVIEIDGSVHQDQREYDIERQGDIETLGYQVIRFTNDEVLYDWENVEKKLMSFVPIPRPLPLKWKG